MELNIEVKMDTRDTFSKIHTVFIADCDGIQFEYDPLKQALKECGFSNVTDENNATVALKQLEYQKTGIARARSGAIIKWFVQNAEGLLPDEITSLWASVWKYHQ